MALNFSSWEIWALGFLNATWTTHGREDALMSCTNGQMNTEEVPLERRAFFPTHERLGAFCTLLALRSNDSVGKYLLLSKPLWSKHLLHLHSSLPWFPSPESIFSTMICSVTPLCEVPCRLWRREDGERTLASQGLWCEAGWVSAPGNEDRRSGPFLPAPIVTCLRLHSNLGMLDVIISLCRCEILLCTSLPPSLPSSHGAQCLELNSCLVTIHWIKNPL